MKALIFSFLLFTGIACFAQQIHSIDTSWIDRMKANTSDTLYVINFWATWCKPCVEELPYFERLGEQYKNSRVKILLVSTDMRKDLNTRVKDFVSTKKLKQQVLFMNEINANKWIDKVSPDWSGAIPGTWFVNGNSGVNYFKEGELSLEELQKLISTHISK